MQVNESERLRRLFLRSRQQNACAGCANQPQLLRVLSLATLALENTYAAAGIQRRACSPLVLC